MDNKTNIIFNYNPHTNKWTAFHRDDWNAYWSGGEFKYAPIRNSNLAKLHAYIDLYGLEKFKTTT